MRLRDARPPAADAAHCRYAVATRVDTRERAADDAMLRAASLLPLLMMLMSVSASAMMCCRQALLARFGPMSAQYAARRADMRGCWRNTAYALLMLMMMMIPPLSPADLLMATQRHC